MRIQTDDLKCEGIQGFGCSESRDDLRSSDINLRHGSGRFKTCQYDIADTVAVKKLHRDGISTADLIYMVITIGKVRHGEAGRRVDQLTIGTDGEGLASDADYLKCGLREG